MALIDLIDLALDVMSRRGTRIVGAMLLLGLIVVAGPTQDLINWYAHQKAQQIVEVIVNVPSTSPLERVEQRG